MSGTTDAGSVAWPIGRARVCTISQSRPDVMRFSLERRCGPVSSRLDPADASIVGCNGLLAVHQSMRNSTVNRSSQLKFSMPSCSQIRRDRTASILALDQPSSSANKREGLNVAKRRAVWPTVGSPIGANRHGQRPGHCDAFMAAPIWRQAARAPVRGSSDAHAVSGWNWPRSQPRTCLPARLKT